MWFNDVDSSFLPPKTHSLLSPGLNVPDETKATALIQVTAPLLSHHGAVIALDNAPAF